MGSMTAAQVGTASHVRKRDARAVARRGQRHINFSRLTTRQHARLVGKWIASIGLDPPRFGSTIKEGHNRPHHNVSDDGRFPRKQSCRIMREILTFVVTEDNDAISKT